MRPLTSLSAALLLLVLIPGCAFSGPRVTATRTHTAPHVPDAPLVVETRNGAVEVFHDGSLTQVEISARITCSGATTAEAEQRLARTSLSVTRGVDQALTVRSVFPDGPRSGDGASFTIRLPAADGVRVRTSNGSVKVAGLGGALDVDTSNGSIRVEDHDGPVTVRSSNGALVLTGVGGPVNARTSNGSVVLELAEDAAGPVQVDTSNGSIKVTVGASFEGAVAFDTSNGAVSVDDRAGRVTSRSLSRKGGTIAVGDGSAPSRIHSSNGAIVFVIDQG